MRRPSRPVFARVFSRSRGDGARHQISPKGRLSQNRDPSRDSNLVIPLAEANMANSPLVPGSTSGQNDRILGRGHGTAALGPSDSSDSGSDVHGGGAERRLG